MANHAYVKTRKHMSFESISELINELNETIFYNCLKIEPWKDRGDDAWGPCGWKITVIDSDGGRICWLNSRQSFEIRHGGGSQFIWWIDFIICQTIRDKFSGRLTDDSGGGDITENIPTNWKEYLDSLNKSGGFFEKSLLKFLSRDVSKIYNSGVKRNKSGKRDQIK